MRRNFVPELMSVETTDKVLIFNKSNTLENSITGPGT